VPVDGEICQAGTPGPLVGQASVPVGEEICQAGTPGPLVGQASVPVDGRAFLGAKRGNLAVPTRKPEIATSPPFADSGRLLAMT